MCMNIIAEWCEEENHVEPVECGECFECIEQEALDELMLQEWMKSKEQEQFDCSYCIMYAASEGFDTDLCTCKNTR